MPDLGRAGAVGVGVGAVGVGVGADVPEQVQFAWLGQDAFLQRPTLVLQYNPPLQFALLPQVPPQELGAPVGLGLAVGVAVGVGVGVSVSAPAAFVNTTQFGSGRETGFEPSWK